MSPKKKRGRGRPPKDTVRVTARVSKKAEMRLKEFMERTGMKPGEAIELAIMALRLPRQSAK